MNIFGRDIESIDPGEARALVSDNQINKLPNVPPFLSRKECAAILGVSMKVINQLVESEQLPLTGIPADPLMQADLFGSAAGHQQEECILRSELADFMERSLLCNKPVLGTDNVR